MEEYRACNRCGQLRKIHPTHGRCSACRFGEQHYTRRMKKHCPGCRRYRPRALFRVLEPGSRCTECVPV